MFEAARIDSRILDIGTRKFESPRVIHGVRKEAES